MVIGSGFGGLAAAVRLGARGYRVTVLDKLDAPGGRAYAHKQDGFTFDAGPTVITAPFLFEELWALCGKRMADVIDMRPVTPFYRIRFPDGAQFDYTGDAAAMRAEIARFEPGARLGRAGEIPDRVGGAIEIGEEIEPLRGPAARRPGVASEEASRGEREVLVQGCAEVRKDLFEYPAHRQDGWPCVDGAPPGVDLTHLASHPRRALEEQDFDASAREQGRGDQAPHAPAHDDDASVPHASIS